MGTYTLTLLNALASARAVLPLGVVLAVVFSDVDRESGKGTVRLDPDPEMQTQIQRVLNASSEGEFRQDLDVLRNHAGDHYRELIPQLLYYSMCGTDAAGKHNVKEAMALGVLADHLEISDESIVATLIPFLETEDPALKKALRGVLPAVENPSQVSNPPSFSFYQTILESRIRKGEKLPLGLVRYMYERHPGSAVLTMKAVFLTRENQKERKAILWAEHVVGNTLWKKRYRFLEKTAVEPEAVAELEKLAAHEAWWARLYVAEILRRYPEFRQGEIVARLAADKHPLVQEAMSFTKAVDEEAEEVR